MLPRWLRRIFRCGSSRSLFFDVVFLMIFIFIFSLIFTRLNRTYKKTDTLEKSAHKKDLSIRIPQINVQLQSANFPVSPKVPPQLVEIKKEDSVDEVNFGIESKLKKSINGINYPKLNSLGNFIPIQRIVHIDMKGGPFKPSFFPQLFDMLSSLRVTGVLLEWEDMFPYGGRLSKAINGNAYSKQEVENILAAALERGLEIIPLVQTFGHLEWILKLEEFAHLRESAEHPQVICIGNSEAWNLLRKMIDEMLAVHSRFAMKYFHMGADEVFQLGICNETINEMQKRGSRESVIAWHIGRVANYIKLKHKVSVMAWHDMLIQMTTMDIDAYHLTRLIEPVIWSYAEDLDQYLSPSVWITLKPFARIWGSSAYKGADGPMRFHSNPGHYIRNNEAWIEQFTMNYKSFDYIQGIVITGWSRYDHLAILCELFPVGVPALAFSLETVIEGRKLTNYPFTEKVFSCNIPTIGFTYKCNFPGSKIYELINELHENHEQIRQFVTTDFDFNGWLSVVARQYNISSPMYVSKILKFIEAYLSNVNKLQTSLRLEMKNIYFDDTIEEFIFTYVARDSELLKNFHASGLRILNQRYFPKRPFF